jgi:hypothetical protein
MTADQRILFQKTVKANAERLSNTLQREAERRAVMDGSRIVTDEEVQQLALSYFDKTLLTTVAERLG